MILGSILAVVYLVVIVFILVRVGALVRASGYSDAVAGAVMSGALVLSMLATPFVLYFFLTRF